MPAPDALLRQVLDQPDDLAVRRVYADALDAAGDPRGELIHVQCKLEDAAVASPAWTALRTRQAELLAKHGKAWAAPYAKLIRKPELRRGMIEDAHVDAKLFAAAPGALLEREPVTSLGTHKMRRDEFLAVRGRPDLARLRSLRVRASALSFSGPGRVEALERLRGLRELHLTEVDLDLGDHDELLVVVFPQLEALSYGIDGLTADQLAEVTAGRQIPKVTSLALRRLPGLRDLVEEIAQQLNQRQLRHLDLGANTFNLAALERFVTNPTVIGLRSFQFDNNLLYDGPRAIELLGALTRLEELDLSTNQIGAGTGAAIAASKLPLRRLDLSQTQMTDAGATALARAALPELRELRLYNDKIGVAGARALVAAPWPLVDLDVSGNPIGDGGATAIAAGAWPRTLRRLKLIGCELTDAGVAALARVEWPALEELSLSGEIGAAGARALAGASMPALSKLMLLRTDTPKGPLGPLKKRGVELAFS
jgi:uncharacterized protein (TIGR02996 family)